MGAMSQSMVTTRLGEIEVFRGGSGEQLVYLHSATGEGSGLPFLDDLAGSFEVIAPMFPGFGQSQGIEAVDDMEDVTFHHLDLWDELELAGPTVVGLSLGGWMAAELATRYPEKVGAMVLVSPVGLYIQGAPIKDIFGRSPGELAGDLFFDQSHPVAQMMHALGDLRYDPAQLGELTFDMIKPVVQTMTATARIGWDPYLHNPKLRDRLDRITAPTMVVRGAHDTLVPPEHADAYVGAIPGACLEVVPDAAHLVSLERPAELAALVRHFTDS